MSDEFDDYLDHDAPDPFLDSLRAVEQIEATLPAHARLVKVYYDALLEAGMPGQIVFVLVRDYANALIHNGF